MRILVFGSARTWRIESCFARALRRAGHEVLLLDDRRLARLLGRAVAQRLIRLRVARFRPEFVLLSKCLGLELETIEIVIRGRATAMWYSDAQWYTHIDSRADIRHIGAVARLASVLWLPAFVDEWRALGYDARHLPFAGDRDIAPGTFSPRLATDIAFLGTGYDAERARVLIELDRHARVRVWGLGWEEWRGQLDWAGHPVEGQGFADVCTSAKITLGITAANARGNPFYTDRMFLSMLAGGFYLGEGGRDDDRMLRDGEHCAWYHSLDECIAKAKQWIADDAGRTRVRAAGERFVREHHTYDERVTHLLSGMPYVPPL